MKCIEINGKKMYTSAEVIECIQNNPIHADIVYMQLLKDSDVSVQTVEDSDLKIMITRNDANHVKSEKIVCFNKLKGPMSADSVSKVLSRMEELDERFGYNANYYICISIYGYISTKASLDVYDYEQFNLEMKDIQYFKKLLDKYFEVLIPGDCCVDLTAYNDYVYRKTLTSIERSNKTCFIQPTGSGKSYVIAALASKVKDNAGVLILTPSSMIVEQFYEHFKWLIDNKNIRVLTYAKLMYLTEDEIEDLSNINTGTVIYDELHRLGAKCWREGVDQIKKILDFKSTYNENSVSSSSNILEGVKEIGVTATPFRNLENRDMAEEYFDNNVSSFLSLGEAIALKILPRPIYVTALYEIESVAKEFNSKMNKLKLNSTESGVVRKFIETLESDFDSKLGIPNILKKHITYQRKFIVFCENINHLKKMIPIVQKWFNDAFPGVTISSYEIHYEVKDSNEILKEFLDNDRGFTLLFGVQSISEGIHSSKIDGTIHLRKSSSIILASQQQGRVFTGYSKKTPIIFDFVNNLKAISTSNFDEMIDDSVEKLNTKRVGLGLPPNLNYSNYDIKTVYDETVDIVEVFKNLECKMKYSFVSFYKKACEFYEKNGHLYVLDSEDEELIDQCRKYRLLYKKGRLSKECIDLLNKIEFIWNIIDYRLMKQYEKLQAFYEKHNHSYVDINYEDKSLYYFVLDTRKRYKKGLLSKDKIDLLNKLDFVWDTNLFSWDEFIKELKEFRKKNGHCFIVSSNVSKKLNNKAIMCRKLKRINELSPEREAQLDELGFIYEVDEYVFDKRCEDLKKFKEKYNTTIVPRSYKDKQLGQWVSDMRKAIKNGTISESHLRKLEALDFILAPDDYYWDIKFNEFKDEYEKIGNASSLKSTLSRSIYIWCIAQRKLYRNGKLNEDRLKKLIEIDFPFE